MIKLSLTILILTLIVTFSPYGLITYYLIKDLMQPIELVSLVPVTLLNALILYAIRELKKDLAFRNKIKRICKGEHV